MNTWSGTITWPPQHLSHLAIDEQLVILEEAALLRVHLLHMAHEPVVPSHLLIGGVLFPLFLFQILCCFVLIVIVVFAFNHMFMNLLVDGYEWILAHLLPGLPGPLAEVLRHGDAHALAEPGHTSHRGLGAYLELASTSSLSLKSSNTTSTGLQPNTWVPNIKQPSDQGSTK